MDRLPDDSEARGLLAGLAEGAPDFGAARLQPAGAGHQGWFTGIGRTGPTPEERLARLVKTIETEIIPKLVHAHRSAGDEAARPHGARRGGRSVREVAPHLQPRAFAQLVLKSEDAVWMAPLESLRSQGCSIDEIYLELLAPAARELGELWNQDLCSFSDVTIGAGRLQQAIRHLSPRFGTEVSHPADGRRAVLLPSPGEQHTLGLSMVIDFFVRDGWEVVGGLDQPNLDVVALVSKEWFDVVGFSLGHAARLPALAMIVTQVRRSSRNRSVAVLVGGPALAEHPDLLGQLGADATALDAKEAPSVAERLLAQRARGRARS